MGKNKTGGGGGGGSGGNGAAAAGTPTLSLEQFADSLVGGGGGGGGGAGSKGNKGGRAGTSDAETAGSSNPESVVEVARWESNPRVHLLRFKSAAAQRDAMVSSERARKSQKKEIK